MTGFRASAFAVAATLAFASPAAGQLGAPYRLIPGGDNPGTLAPPPGLPKPQEQVVRDEGVLRTPELRDVGVLDSHNGGLPATVWSGSNRQSVDPLVMRLTPTRLPALAQLGRRAIATAAPPPAGEAADSGPSFAALRAAALLRLGDVAGARAIAERLSRGEAEPAARAVTRDALFLAGDADGACVIVQDSNSEAIDWQQALIACQAIAGDLTRAQLGITLLREQQGGEDDWLDRLVAHAGGAKRALEGGRGPLRPHHVPLFGAAKLAPGPAAIEAASPAVQAALAASDGIPADARLRAAEPAVAAGALGVEALAVLYDGVTLNARESADAFAFAERERGPRSRAALYKAIKAQEPGAERAAIVAKAIGIVERRGMPALVAFRRAVLPRILDLIPDAAAAPHAPAMIRALLGEGRTPEASRWLDLLRPGSGFGERTAALAPLMALGGAADRNFLADDTLRQWREGQIAADAARGPSRVRLLAEIFAALNLPTSELQGAGTPSPIAAPAPVSRLSRAASARLLGETILLSTAILDDTGLRDNPTAIGAVVRALNAVGLASEARAISLDAALGAGL